MQCPICSYKDVRPRYEVYDVRYGFPGSFELRGCDRCRYHFLAADFSPELIEWIYRTYYPRAATDASGVKPFRVSGALKTWFNRG